VDKGRLLFLAGSLGLVEIAAREESAAKKLGAKAGEEVRIIIKSKE
ncbi:MAG: SAM hydroxide adenosyltransferase, partial [Candidatus Aminicenantales bacterium]